MKSRESIREQGLEKLAEIREQDILTVDLSQESVLTTYLLPSVNLKLRPKILSEMAPGSRVVSHAFDMGDWKPDKLVRINDRTVYYETVPKEVLSGIRTPASRSASIFWFGRSLAKLGMFASAPARDC